MTTRTANPPRPFDRAVVRAAERTVNDALADFLSPARPPRGVVVAAPAGAGKTQLVTTAVSRARAKGLRVAVATPTNDQAFGLVRRIAQLHCSAARDRVHFIPASKVTPPADLTALSGVRIVSAADANSKDLIVGTLDKLGDAFGRGSLDPFDALLVDESYQADSAKYFAVAGLARRHLLVGDSGQISPFSTIDDPCRWRGLPEDPLQTAVGVLRRNHPDTPFYGMPITRRLDARAARLARLFYPDLSFSAAVLPGVRELRLLESSSPNKPLQGIDAALSLTSRDGWAHLELPCAPVLQADPDTIDLIATLLCRLFQRDPHVRCERAPEPTRLRPGQVAVGVSHNDQKDLLRVALNACDLGGVVVETANKLQGLEFEVVVVWHPLAGLPEPDAFHLDPGRLCVLLTRHRQACIVIGRAGDHEVLADQLPPSTPAYLCWDPDPVLDGWEMHRQVFDALAPLKIPQ